jgi:hypothetical protein
MSTNSTIAIQYKDNSVKGIYCHWDGYPSGVGKTLQDNYNSAEKVEELINGGFLSSLNNTIDECEYYAKRSEWDFSSDESSDEPWEEVCPIVSKDYDEFIKHNSQEFNYLYIAEQKKWFFRFF